MRSALIASAAVHVALLVGGALSLDFGKELQATPVDSLPVDLVPVSELTKLQLGSKTAKEIKEVSAVEPTKKPAPEPPKEKNPGETKKDTPPAKVKAPKPAPATEAPPPPEPEPEPTPIEAEPKAPTVEKPVAELGPDVEKTEKPQKLVTARPRTKPKPPKVVKKEPPKKKKPDFNANKIAALLDKRTPTGGGAASSTEQASIGSAKGQANVRMSQSELDALRGQIARCWNPPVGAAGAENLVVEVQFGLSRTGEVAGQPQVLNSSNNPAFRAAASSAVRAVYRCGPYSLPAAKYEAWKTVKINFDPREMLGF